MTETTQEARLARRGRHEAILAEVAQEEAEAAEADIAEKAIALDAPLHLRIDRDLDAELRHRAAAEHIPTSALVRRLLRQAVHDRPGAITVTDVEDIARRVAREEHSEGPNDEQADSFEDGLGDSSETATLRSSSRLTGGSGHGRRTSTLTYGPH